MKNKHLYLIAVPAVLSIFGCQKDLTGNAISIEAHSNVKVKNFHLYSTCRDGPNQLPLGNFDPLNEISNGYYTYQIDKGYETECFTVTGTVPENTDSTGETTVDITAFYTDAGNKTGFQKIELQRPHESYKIRYEFRPDTYIE
ncbi:MAG: hypothetical protein ACQERC_01730 [Bacteroidota bacterium]